MQSMTSTLLDQIGDYLKSKNYEFIDFGCWQTVNDQSLIIQISQSTDRAVSYISVSNPGITLSSPDIPVTTLDQAKLIVDAIDIANMHVLTLLGEFNP